MAPNLLTRQQHNVLRLHQRGFTPSEMAKLLGVTRQRIHQILDKLRELGEVK